MISQNSWPGLLAHAVMHELTLKTVPKPETAATILHVCPDAATARTVYASPHEASVSAMIPVATAVFSKSPVFADFAQKGTIVAIRVEGFDLLSGRAVRHLPTLR